MPEGLKSPDYVSTYICIYTHTYIYENNQLKVLSEEIPVL